MERSYHRKVRRSAEPARQTADEHWDDLHYELTTDRNYFSRKLTQANTSNVRLRRKTARLRARLAETCSQLEEQSGVRQEAAEVGSVSADSEPEDVKSGFVPLRSLFSSPERCQSNVDSGESESQSEDEEEAKEIRVSERPSHGRWS